MSLRLARIVGVAAMVAAAVSLSADQRETRERGIVVSVSGARDVPVADMTAADFVVRENGVAREVLRVSPAPPPSHVVLLVDDSQATESSLAYLRPGVTAFIKSMGALWPAPQQALWTFGERPTRRVDVNPNPDALVDATRRIFAITGSGAYFLQGITEVSRDLRKREAPSPIIVAFVAESGPEFSSELRQQVADSLRRIGASLWAVALQHGAQAPGSGIAARERAAVLGDVTAESGGMNRVVLSSQGIESAFRTLATLISSRYLVTYGRPDALVPPDKIEVTSPRRDVRVRASRWAGR